MSSDILVPRYYDPGADEDLRRLKPNAELVSIGELVRTGVLELQTGDEVGKLSYGGGDVAFIRTSDFGNWELKHDPKQRVSGDVYEKYAARQSVREDDLLLVRDGTYLVGTTTIVRADDLPLLYSGGIYRIRVLRPDDLHPALLLALLNMQIVRRQIRNKRFTRDVIDTLGHRILEVVLPIPSDVRGRNSLTRAVSELLKERALLRDQANSLRFEVESA